MNRFQQLLIGFILTSHTALLSAPQIVTGPTATLDTDGFLDGASLQGQAAVPSTLFVPLNQTVNFNNNAVGISTDSFAKGTVIFEGNSHVFGTTGISGGNPLFSLQTQTDDVNFHGAVSAQNFSLSSRLFTIGGNLTLPTTGTALYSSILSDTVFGRITVENPFSNTINSPSINVILDSSNALNLTNGQQFDILFAPTGTSNVPITISNNNVRYAFSSTFPSGSTNGRISVTATKVPISSLVDNPNAKAVGDILDAVLPIAGAFPESDLAYIETQLGLPSAAALEHAVLQLSAAPLLTGVGRETFNTTKQFQRIWLEHLQRDRSITGFERFDSQNDPCRAECTNLVDSFKIWADGFMYYGHQGDKKFFNGYDVHTWGTVLAGEMPFTCHLRGGFGFGYAYSNLKGSKFGNTTKTHYYQGTFFLSYHRNSWFMDGGLSLGWNRYDGTRHIHFNAVERNAKSKYNGQEVTPFLATGFRLYCDGWEITPMGSIIYTYLHQGKFREKGADALNLRILDQNFHYLQTNLGVKGAYLLETCYGSFIPEIHTYWIHDFNRSPVHATGMFDALAGAGGTFSNRGTGFDQNLWNIGASITFWATPNVSILGVYDYETGSSYFDHLGLIELTYDF